MSNNKKPNPNKANQAKVKQFGLMVLDEQDKERLGNAMKQLSQRYAGLAQDLNKIELRIAELKAEKKEIEEQIQIEESNLTNWGQWLKEGEIVDFFDAFEFDDFTFKWYKTRAQEISGLGIEEGRPLMVKVTGENGVDSWEPHKKGEENLFSGSDDLPDDDEFPWDDDEEGGEQ